MQRKIILLLSAPLVFLVTMVSCVGLLTPDFYSGETLNWQAQSIGQDIVDVFLITPCLIISVVLTYKHNRAGTMIWGGVMLYLSYTFALYSFDVHFNKLFVLYCICLGVSFYSFLYFLLIQYRESSGISVERTSASRFIGIYFITIAIIFYALWLSEIIPSIIQNTTPQSIINAGLLTNGVQVLDLAMMLPAIFISGILLLKGKSFGFILAPVFLTFMILMDLTIGILAVVMKIRGVESELTLTLIMSVLAAVSFVLLIWFLKRLPSTPVQ